MPSLQQSVKRNIGINYCLLLLTMMEAINRRAMVVVVLETVQGLLVRCSEVVRD
jgi:hypothetical protein